MPQQIKNPFEYEAANNLSDDDILDFYIEDYNYSRFLNSNRNIFLVGERGAGKTMTLLYHSFRLQHKKALKSDDKIEFDRLGIHIPCNTPLFHKKEYLLFNDDFKASILCEHYLVLTIVYSICDALKDITEIKNVISEGFSDDFFDEFEYLVDTEKLNRSVGFIESIRRFTARELNVSQRKINSENSEDFYQHAYTFSSIVIPFIKILKELPLLKDSHFLLMIDDAHDLNNYQIRTINSWIAYRDHSDFSFKIAAAKTARPEFITSTGGSILEGHDFLTVDMEKPLQNERSDFYLMAKDILNKRLSTNGFTETVEDFFPENREFKQGVDACKETVKAKYLQTNPDATNKQVTDHVYKYARAEYFRNRSSKANLPPYAGFETIVDVSTGVIRNLLDPCFWMFDSALSSNSDSKPLTFISPTIQHHIIIERSKRMWERLTLGLDREVEGCTKDQSKQLYNLFESLTVLFKRRLLEHPSEPRAITFSISLINSTTEDIYEQVIALLQIAQRTQLLYTRLGSAKELGRQEVYYVPNRMLLPLKGLDPHGQYSRISLKVTDIYNAAVKNIEFPFSKTDNSDKFQGELF